MNAKPRGWKSLVLVLAVFASCTPNAGPSADLLFLGDHILTLGPESATAVAVTGDRIVWTGNREDSAAWQGPRLQ